jgi:hypothetical protein
MTSINDARNNKNLNNNSSDGGVKWLIKWELRNFRRTSKSAKKAEDSCEKVVFKAPLKRNCCDVCKFLSVYFFYCLSTDKGRRTKHKNSVKRKIFTLNVDKNF